MFFSATCLANHMLHSTLQSHASFKVLLGVPAKLDHLRKIGARVLDGFCDRPPPKLVTFLTGVSWLLDKRMDAIKQ